MTFKVGDAVKVKWTGQKGEVFCVEYGMYGVTLEEGTIKQKVFRKCELEYFIQHEEESTSANDWVQFRTDIKNTNLEKQHDVVEEPSHYTQGGIEPLDFIMSNNMTFNEGNVVKYVTRYKYKNGLEDLKKAKVYLERLIKKVENE